MPKVCSSFDNLSAFRWSLAGIVGSGARRKARRSVRTHATLRSTSLGARNWPWPDRVARNVDLRDDVLALSRAAATARADIDASIVGNEGFTGTPAAVGLRRSPLQAV